MHQYVIASVLPGVPSLPTNTADDNENTMSLSTNKKDADSKYGWVDKHNNERNKRRDIRLMFDGR